MTSGVSRRPKSPKRRRSSGLTTDSLNPCSVKNCRTGLARSEVQSSMHPGQKAMHVREVSGGDDLRQYRARVEALFSIQR